MTQPLDTILINDLTIPCIIGVSESERKEKQPVKITIAISIDSRKAGHSDAISDTVSYHDLASEIGEKVSGSSFYLLEKLAQFVADICLKDKRVKQVRVTIEKPKAIKLAVSATIEIVRTNE
jgi:FolB domain-containing protein